jgi:hypothetical protein
MECLFIRHLSLQYFTSSQTFSHFLRHVKGRPQTKQSLLASADFLRGDTGLDLGETKIDF